MSDCDHVYEFLREEKKNEGFERNPRWVYYDVYFCSRCLNYEKVKIKETVPSRHSFGEDTVWRKP